MKKEKVDATGLIHKLEFARECAEVGEDFDSVKEFSNAIRQIKDVYSYENSVNPFIGTIEIKKDRAIIKCDVWAKMAVVDFHNETGVWIPKTINAFKYIKYFNGCN